MNYSLIQQPIALSKSSKRIQFLESRHKHIRPYFFILMGLLLILAMPSKALAADFVQQTSGGQSEIFAQGPAGAPLLLPSYWYLIMAALSLLTPAGFVLVSVSGLEPERAWDAAIGGLAAMGLTGFAYWAVGFGLHFGGVGLVHTLPDLQSLVWEWSPIASEWGSEWGMAGLTGWFLSGTDLSPLAYALFLAHLPWAMTAAALPIVALRGRAPALITLLLALLIGGIIYPLAGNWVQGGGWLSALGRNVALGHGFIDFAGAGTVHLLAGAFALATLIVWRPRRTQPTNSQTQLPPVQLPLLATLGGMLILAGALGWYWSNPLQVVTLSELGLMRGSVNLILCASGAALAPILYSWFVTGRTDPMLGARGLAAGAVTSMALAPFISTGVAFLCGFFVGATVPFVMFIADRTFRLDDATGVLHISLLPSILGLLMVGIFADGVTGQGWQATGVGTYLGVADQGVSGLFVANQFAIDFPGQLQAQVLGVLVLSMWGFMLGMILCTPLGLFFFGIEKSANSQLLTGGRSRRMNTDPNLVLSAPSRPPQHLSEYRDPQPTLQPQAQPLVSEAVDESPAIESPLTRRRPLLDPNQDGTGG